MLSVRAPRPLLSSSFSLTFSSPKRSPKRNLPFKYPSAFISMSSSTSSPPPHQIIEHVVLFKVNPATPSEKVSSMVDGLNSLSSLSYVSHILAAPVHRTRSNSLTFTHVLHSRYKTKEDLSAYSSHPDHVRVVKDSVLPICDDIMAVDWVAPNSSVRHVAPPPGSAIRVTLLKLKEGVTEEEKGKVLEVVGGIKEKVKGVEEASYGENFSPGRAKGFGVASAAVFKGLEELEGVVGEEEEVVRLEKEKVREYLDDVVDVDFVVPAKSSSL